MKRKIILAVIIVLVIFGALAGIKVLQIRKLVAGGKSFAPPPETISTAVVHEEKWQESLPAVGSIVAVQGVTLTPEIAGTVSEIAFESGAVVAQGDLLVRLDTSIEEAQLRALEAQVAWWKISAERTRQLWTNNAISKSDMDDAEATLKAGVANADALHATIAKKNIRAPFAGRTGIRQVNLGEAIDKGNPIVSLQSLAPVFGNFSLPQQELAKVKTGMTVRLTLDAFPGQHFDGTLTAINPDLDPVMRSAGLQATFANAEQLLRPGMFAQVEVLLPEEQPVLAIPATAILSAPFGDSVYVVENSTNSAGGLVVRQQFVRVGRVKGDFVSLESGLKAGERIVSSGLFKLRNGMSVVVNNDISPQVGPETEPGGQLSPFRSHPIHP